MNFYTIFFIMLCYQPIGLFNPNVNSLGFCAPQGKKIPDINKTALQKAVINWWGQELAAMAKYINGKKMGVVVIDFYEDFAATQTSLKSIQAIRSELFAWAENQQFLFTVQTADTFLEDLNAAVVNFLQVADFEVLWKMDKKKHKQLSVAEFEEILARELPIAVFFTKNTH